jgi:HEAT repeat protein
MTTPNERLAALDAAVRGPERDRAILMALEDEAVPVRERAIRLAARYVEPAVLGAMVADGENAVRRNAGLSALERQGPYAVPHLTVMLGDPDPELVMFALQSLARIGYAPAARSIIPLLHHGDPNVAQAAIEAVGLLRAREAVPALLKLVNGELWLQLAAINALGAIGAPEAVGPLMALVPDSVLAEPAVQALRSIAAPESLAPLLAVLPVVRERALSDPLLLAIGVIIDLHPDPAPLLEAAGPAIAESGPLVEYLGQMLAAGTEEEESDAESLHRAAATLVIAAGLEVLEPVLLARLATNPESGWIEGLFRRFPGGLAARRTRLIADADPDVRSGALRAARFEDDELPELFEHLEDPTEQVRAAACYAMGRLELDAAAPFLAERLRRGGPAEQAAAAQALGRLSAEALGELESCFRGDTPEAVLILVLGVMAERPVPAFEPAVLRLAEDRRPAVRRAALRAAARVPGSRTDVLLLRALADRQPATQVEALDLLVGRGGAQSVAMLVAMLGTADSLRFHIIRALGHCRAAAAAPKLRSVFPECGPHEQLQIVAALIRIAPEWIAEFLRDRLSDSEVEMRRIAAQGLADLADERDIGLLLPLADDADWGIRNEVARGLGRLAKPATRHVLLALARDVEPVVAATARTSLDRLQPEAIRISA